ncbi:MULTISPECIES: response regulator transcription factor [unclassified Bacillus (in: firmicutes)]|uniref:response regulator transcription factor n=1 Tax=unclassified Bacillus (in: firmicutes) TaxID=185979 RepID=UPI00080AD0DE|nr:MULTISPECIES: response regulator transcription factor [unclassified Bacillus (in: firmicutes)]OCA81795.1 hypothetical protein A8L44_14425 [Bacillus sp. FJAT-27986]
MFNVLIVDDEPMIREGLKTLINWEEYGFRIIALARNGKEGYEEYCRCKPDLMIVDIRMPEMDGISLIELIRAEDNDISFIVLSGYSDFAYAKRAIKAKTAGYLLKPIDEEELIQYLIDLRQNIEERKQWSSLIQAEYCHERDEFLASLCLNDFKEMANVQENLHKFELEDSGCQILLIQCYENGQKKIKSELVSFFEDCKKGVVFTINGYAAVYLRSDYSFISRTDMIKQKLMKQIHPFCKSIALGEFMPSVYGIQASYQTALTLIKHQFYFEKGQILTKSHRKELDSAHGILKEELLLDEYLNRLYYAIDVVNIDTCRTVIDELGREMMHRDFSEQQIKKQFIYIYTHTMNKLLQLNSSIGLDSMKVNDCATDIYKIETMSDLIEYIFQQFESIIKRIDNGLTGTQMKKMIDLIHKNYNQNLRLESLAGVFNYNSAYLGKLFKNYTGEYFNTYLDKVRIENGKILLQKGLKVYEVAEKIGYADVDYFHRKFKKYEGISPSAYRNHTG